MKLKESNFTYRLKYEEYCDYFIIGIDDRI